MAIRGGKWREAQSGESQVGGKKTRDLDVVTVITRGRPCKSSRRVFVSRLTVNTNRELALSLILSRCSLPFVPADFPSSIMLALFSPAGAPERSIEVSGGVPVTGKAPLSPPFSASDFCLPGCLPDDKSDQAPTIGLNVTLIATRGTRSRMLLLDSWRRARRTLGERSGGGGGFGGGKRAAVSDLADCYTLRTEREY